MIKILILAYYFPPGNFAGSHRIAAWVRHLSTFGIYPIVITRHWEDNESDYTRPSSERVVSVEQFDGYKVIRVPFDGMTKDKLQIRFGKLGALLAKILSPLQIFLQPLSAAWDPFYPLFKAAQKVIVEEKDIRVVVTSGRPFILFKYGFKLKTQWRELHWIADYRDPWTSNSLNVESAKRRILAAVERRFEVKWVSHADLVISVSKGVLTSISSILKVRKSLVVSNCFEPTTSDAPTPTTSVFTITYLGTLYSSQHIEMFLDGLVKFIEMSAQPAIRLQFIGTLDDEKQKNRIFDAYPKLQKYITIVPKIQKHEVHDILVNSHVFLICGILGRSGTMTAKLFDYIRGGRPIILCPSDKDSLASFIDQHFPGNVCSSNAEAYLKITEFYEKWRKGESFMSEFNPGLEEHSCRNQTLKLAEAIKKML